MINPTVWNRAMQMEMSRSMKRMKKNQQTAEQERIAKEKLHQSCTELRAKHVHLHKVKLGKLMWAVATFGAAKIDEIASNHLTGFHFQQQLVKLSN